MGIFIIIYSALKSGIIVLYKKEKLTKRKEPQWVPDIDRYGIKARAYGAEVV